MVQILRPLPPPRAWLPPLRPDGSVPVDLLALLPEEIEAYIDSLGEPRYRARQIIAWLHGRAVHDLQQITVLPQSVRERLAQDSFVPVPEIVRRQADPVDGTVKYLLRLTDGETVETVLMRYRFGYSLCVSSQVGCRMGCRFCASTIGGLRRNLGASEMVAQLQVAQRDLRQGLGADPPFDRVSRIVVMGMGEPLENLDAVLRFLSLAHLPEGYGIGWRHLTVSTSGLVPAIDRLAQEQMPITLAVSLHAPNDAVRDRLMPINRRYPLDVLIAACRRYQEATGRRLTFEYVLIAGVNDLPEHARELADLLRGLLCHVNLIPLNPVAERALVPTSHRATATFAALLRGAGVPATVRRQLGTSIDAACGQLRHRTLASGNDAESRQERPTDGIASGGLFDTGQRG